MGASRSALVRRYRVGNPTVRSWLMDAGVDSAAAVTVVPPASKPALDRSAVTTGSHRNPLQRRLSVRPRDRVVVDDLVTTLTARPAPPAAAVGPRHPDEHPSGAQPVPVRAPSRCYLAVLLPATCPAITHESNIRPTPRRVWVGSPPVDGRIDPPADSRWLHLVRVRSQ